MPQGFPPGGTSSASQARHLPLGGRLRDVRGRELKAFPVMLWEGSVDAARVQRQFRRYSSSVIWLLLMAFWMALAMTSAARVPAVLMSAFTRLPLVAA